MRRLTSMGRAALAAMLLAGPAAAQGTAGTWRTAFDRAGAPDSVLKVGTMPPGWHTSLAAGAPGVVLFDPAVTGGRTFTLEVEAFFFGSAPGAGLGLVIAGRGLDTPAPRFVAFSVFPDGRISVTRHAGPARDRLVLPTPDAAVNKHPGGQVDVKNVLSLVGDEAKVTFRVNGTVVATLPRAVVDPGGLVGLRLEPGANVHVATFALDGRNRAPVPTR